MKGSERSSKGSERLSSTTSLIGKTISVHSVGFCCVWVGEGIKSHSRRWRSESCRVPSRSSTSIRPARSAMALVCLCHFGQKILEQRRAAARTCGLQ